MAKRPSDGGGSTAYREDQKLLMDLFKQFYFIKSLWRMDAGFIELPSMMDAWVKKQDARTEKLINSPTRSLIANSIGEDVESTSNLTSVVGTVINSPIGRKKTVAPGGFGRKSSFPAAIKARRLTLQKNAISITGRPVALGNAKVISK